MAGVNDVFKWKDDGDDGFKSANAQKKDPLRTYGVGLTNYFVLHRNVAWAFFWCSILAFGQIFIYRSFGGLDYMDNMTTYARISFGNMGFSSTDCAKNIMNWEGEETNLYL